jgi:hypothetical protein
MKILSLKLLLVAALQVLGCNCQRIEKLRRLCFRLYILTFEKSNCMLCDNFIYAL